MTFNDLKAGDDVFVDSNVLIYHFAPDPVYGAACTDLLVRIKRQEIRGYTSTDVVSETSHRLMTLEAIKAQGWPATGIAQRLRKHPAVIQKLLGFRQGIQEIFGFGIQVLAIPPNLLDPAAGVSQAIGLLTNDALVVAMMQAHGLSRLASNDSDFDRVPGITRYGPV